MSASLRFHLHAPKKVCCQRMIDLKYRRSQDLAITPLLPFRRGAASSTTAPLRRTGIFFLAAHCDVDGCVEDLVHAGHFLGRALHVPCTHLVGYGTPLRLGDGCQTLCPEELDAGAFGAEVRFEAAEDDGRCWAEVEDFWVPLQGVLAGVIGRIGCKWFLPCRVRSPASSDSQSQSRRRVDRSRDMTAVVGDHTLLVLRYPKAPVLRPCRKACARHV